MASFVVKLRDTHGRLWSMTALGAMIRREIAPERIAGHAKAIAPSLDEIWIVEDVPYAGGISQLAHLLEATENVTVGHGIAPAPFRNPMALAMEWATLARLYPGRLAGGIGHGLQTWMASIGEKVDSPLTLLEETIVATKQLLRGQDPNMAGRYRSLSGYQLEFPGPRQATPNPIASRSLLECSVAIKLNSARLLKG
nr:putative LLM class flavin-dependent oxidoreductase [uncultured bacterium]